MKKFLDKYFMWISVLGTVLLVSLDQWTKALAAAHLKGASPLVLWQDVFEFHYFENTGAAWGMLRNKQTFFYILTIVFFALIVWEIKRLYKNSRFIPLMYTLVFMFAGAAGNFIDRVVHKYVIDFIYVKLIDFPIFNLADCYITISVVVLLLLMFFYYSDEEFDTILPVFSHKNKKEK